MPPKAGNMKDRVKVMEDADRDKYLHDIRKNWLKEKTAIDQKNAKHNLSKIQESWLKIMRSAKTKQLKREVEIIAQNHERDVDRKDAILQMLDRDIDEAEEQHQVAIRRHLLNMDRLIRIQDSRLEALEQDFKENVRVTGEQFSKEKKKIAQKQDTQKKQLLHIISEVNKREELQEQLDIQEHQSLYEMIRNKNIEEDHQMRSQLEEKIEVMKDKCNSALNAFRNSTETNTVDYKSFLARDGSLSKHVEKKLRQVERMQNLITNWKAKIKSNANHSQERNAHLRNEKDHLSKHFQELKGKMNKFREEERRRLMDLTVNCRGANAKLSDQLRLGESILTLAGQCSRYETEREKVLPFYQGTALESVDVNNLPNEALHQYIEDFDQKQVTIDGGMDEQYTQIREEIKQVLQDEQAMVKDEWNYLDGFFKRYNKVHLDVLAIEKEKTRLKTENTQLRSILKQFLDGVAVNEDVLSKPNPLLVVNGQVNLNYMQTKKPTASKNVVEIQTAVKNM